MGARRGRGLPPGPRALPADHHRAVRVAANDRGHDRARGRVRRGPGRTGWTGWRRWPPGATSRRRPRRTAGRRRWWTRRKRRRQRPPSPRPHLCRVQTSDGRSGVGARRHSLQGQLEPRRQVAARRLEAPLPREARRARRQVPGGRGSALLRLQEHLICERLGRSDHAAREAREPCDGPRRPRRAAHGLLPALPRLRRGAPVLRALHGRRAPEGQHVPQASLREQVGERVQTRGHRPDVLRVGSSFVREGEQRDGGRLRRRARGLRRPPGEPRRRADLACGPRVEARRPHVPHLARDEHGRPRLGSIRPYVPQLLPLHGSGAREPPGLDPLGSQLRVLGQQPVALARPRRSDFACTGCHAQ